MGLKVCFMIGILLLSSCGSFVSKRGLASSEQDQREIYQVGEVKISLLEASDFRDNYGNAWVLMDGRDVSDSEFSQYTAMTELPDARGKFLRMSNNGVSGAAFDPDKERALGSYQGDQLKSHNHSYTNPKGSSRLGHFNRDGWEGTPNSATSSTGGEETRPKNILVNFYVKIRSCLEEDGRCL